MKRISYKQSHSIIAEWKYRRGWKKLTAVLSLFIAAATLALLMLPAITMNDGQGDSAASVSETWTGSAVYMNSGAVTGNRISDPVTINDWKTYFNTDINQLISTEFAGGIINDKSVTTSSIIYNNAAGNNGTIEASPGNFLVGLSTMASTQTVAGMKSAPVDVMFVLDLSSSMYDSTNVDPDTVINMVDAVNKSIANLNALNTNNRVGVVVYYGYGYVDKQSDSSYSVIVMPLARYSNPNNSKEFLEATTKGSKLNQVKLVDGVEYTDKESTASPKAYTVPTANSSVAGTYAQLGILDALSEFMAVENTTAPRNDGSGMSDPRRPVFVFMSDGMPTAASSNYSQKDKATMGNNQEASRHAAQTDFVTQLTAAYAKECVKANYKESSAAGNLPLYYTLGLTYKGSRAVSMDVMDPDNAHTVGTNSDGKNTSNFDVSAQIQTYWESLVSSGSVTFTTRHLSDSHTSLDSTVMSSNWYLDTHVVEKVTKTVKGETFTFPSSTSQKLYVDEFFKAESEDELQDAFADIMIEISLQQPYETTLTKNDFEHEGYVTFVDTIGKYMSVEKIEGLIIQGRLYNGLILAQNLPSTDNQPYLEQEYRLGFGADQEPTELGVEFVINVGTQLGLKPTYDGTKPLGERGNEDYKTVMDLIGGAYRTNQLHYTSNTDYSNYIEWWASADATGSHRFLGFCHEAGANCGTENCNHSSKPEGATYRIKSYFYLAPTNSEDLGTEISSNLMYSMVWVRTAVGGENNGQQSVIFALPNALLPTVDYFVGLDMDGGVHRLKVSGANTPAMLAYQVGLDPEVSVGDIIKNDPTYNGINRNDAGEVTSVDFYSNEFDLSNPKSTENTFVYFTPSTNNGRYYYTGPINKIAGNNTPIYVRDSSGADGYVLLTNKDSAPMNEASAEYFEHFMYFTAETGADGNPVYNVVTEYKRIAHSGIERAAWSEDAGCWVIPPGTPHAMTTETLDSRYTINKTANVTGTANTSDSPYINVARFDTDGAYLVGALLGNNGKLTVTPITFSGTKMLEGVNDKSKYIFDFDMYATGADFAVSSDSTPYMTAHNSGEGYDEIVFDTMWLNPGRYYYVVQEKEYYGIICDNTVYKISITVTDDMEITVVAAKSVSGEEAGENVGADGLDFKNSARFELPATGGIGTHLFTYGGLLLMLLASVGLIVNWFWHRKEAA